ncbi:hypothetical protein BGX30_008246, partial [Mortierella sp. GBA39]
ETIARFRGRVEAKRCVEDGLDRKGSIAFFKSEDAVGYGDGIVITAVSSERRNGLHTWCADNSAAWPRFRFGNGFRLGPLGGNVRDWGPIYEASRAQNA